MIHDNWDISKVKKQDRLFFKQGEPLSFMGYPPLIFIRFCDDKYHDKVECKDGEGNLHIINVAYYHTKYQYIKERSHKSFEFKITLCIRYVFKRWEHSQFCDEWLGAYISDYSLQQMIEVYNFVSKNTKFLDEDNFEQLMRYIGKKYHQYANDVTCRQYDDIDESTYCKIGKDFLEDFNKTFVTKWS